MGFSFAVARHLSIFASAFVAYHAKTNCPSVVAFYFILFSFSVLHRFPFRVLALLVGLLLSIALTNRWFVTEPAQLSVQKFDAVSYWEIARAAPHFPQEIHVLGRTTSDSLARVPFHHAQRFFVPYFVGSIAHTAGISEKVCFTFAQLILALLTAYILWKSACVLGLSGWSAMMIPVLFLCNPYCTRYFFAETPMLPYTVFLCGFSVLLYGLLTQRWHLVLGGLIFAAFGRQTSLLLLPPVVLWLYLDSAWRAAYKKVHLALLGGVSVFVVLLWYAVSGTIAAEFAGENINTAHLTEVFSWFLRTDTSFTSQEASSLAKSIDIHNLGTKLAIFCTFLFRGVIPFIPAIIMILNALWQRRKENTTLSTQERIRLRLLLMFVVCIVAQPIAGGPELTGSTIIVLSALGVPALCLVFAQTYTEREPTTDKQIAIFIILQFVGSFHHLYTTFGYTYIHPAVFTTLWFLMPLLYVLKTQKPLSTVEKVA